MSNTSDEAAVRTYLRLLVGAPERAGDSMQSAERKFIAVVARWSRRTGVDRRTLAGLGVPKAVLDRAGMIQPPVDEFVRRSYTRTPFDVATLARRACVSEGSVRQTLADDERTGLVERVTSPSRATRWRKATK